MSSSVCSVFSNDESGLKSISTKGLLPGHKVMASPSAAPTTIGNTLPLTNIPVGIKIHNVELKPGKGGKICRSAGGFCTIIKKETVSDTEEVMLDPFTGRPRVKGYATIKLSSGEQRLIPLGCTATIGVVSNKNHNKQVYGKAGASRYVTWRTSLTQLFRNVH